MITFIRHGKTTYNDQRLFSGQIDCDLSKQGIEDNSIVYCINHAFQSP